MDSGVEMKIIAVFLTFSYINELLAGRSLTIDSFEYSPKYSDLIDFSSLKLNKVESKNDFVLDGNFTFKRSLGNEKTVTFEVLKGRVALVRNVHAFCQFIKSEKMFWPDLVESSNMPKDNPCPFPAVSEPSTILRFNIF